MTEHPYTPMGFNDPEAARAHAIDHQTAKDPESPVLSQSPHGQPAPGSHRDTDLPRPEERDPHHEPSNCRGSSNQADAARIGRDEMPGFEREDELLNQAFLEGEKAAVYKARIEDIVLTLRSPTLCYSCEDRIFLRKQIERLEYHMLQEARATSRHLRERSVHVCSDPFCRALYDAGEAEREFPSPVGTAANRYKFRRSSADTPPTADQHRSNGGDQ